MRVWKGIFLFGLLMAFGLGGCTTTPYEDNTTSGYAPTRYSVHNLKQEEVTVYVGTNRFTLDSNESKFLGARCGTTISATWVKKGRPGGRDYKVPCGRGSVVLIR